MLLVPQTLLEVILFDTTYFPQSSKEICIITQNIVDILYWTHQGSVAMWRSEIVLSADASAGETEAVKALEWFRL